MVCQFCLSSQRPSFIFINLYYCFFHFFFIYFCSDLYDFFPYTKFVFFSFSSCFRGKVRFSIRCFSCFVRYGCIATNFPLRTAFGASYRFCFVMFSLSFVSRNFFISLLISSVTHWLFRNVLFNLHVFVFLTVFSL